MKYDFTLPGGHRFLTMPDAPPRAAAVFFMRPRASGPQQVSLRRVLNAALFSMCDSGLTPVEQAHAGCVAAMCAFTLEQRP